MRLTRRGFAGTLAATAVLGAPAPAKQAPAELRKAAGEKMREDGQALAKFPAPMEIEPAFTFKA
jgi:hypothetical protein